MRVASQVVILFAAILLVTGSVPAQEREQASSSQTQPQKESEPPKDDRAQTPPPITVNEYVYVEGSLTYVPRSNTIVTKLPLERRSTPNNVGVVTEPLASERFDRVLGSALENVSNVNVQTQSGVADFFYVRGFDSLSSGLILTDGAPEPETSFYQLYNVELVEVLKGPGGFLYGRNPLAAAVNLVRKQPVPAPLLGFGASAGSFDRYEGSFDWNHGTAENRAAFRLNGLFRDEGSYRDGKDGRTFAINPTASVRFGDRGRLNLSFEYLDLDYVPDAGIPVVFGDVVPVDPATSYQSSMDDSTQGIYRFQADYEWRFSERFSIRNKFFQRTLDWNSGGTILSGAVPTGPTSVGVIRTFVELDDRQSFTGNQLEAVFTFDTGSVSHSLLTGFELDRFGDDYTLDVGLLQTIDAYNPVPPPDSPPTPLPDQSAAGDSRSIVAAPYAIDQIRFGDRLNVLVGGRIDSSDFSDQVSGTDRSDTDFSPMAGALYAINPVVSVYGNYTRAFAPPSPRVVGERVPETGTQYEGGVKTRFDKIRTEATFAVYRLERDNIAIPDDNGFTQQIGNQRSSGFEVDIAAQPSSTTRAFFSYAINDSELTEFAETIQIALFPPAYATVDRSGNDPAFAPRHVMNLWASKDFSRRWGVGGGARYVSSQYIAEDNAFAIDGVLTFDATAFYRIGDARLRLNLKNITDREYFLRGFGSNSVIPAPPFTVYFGFDYRM
jgi:TonB-dependent siderophore receptor